jgi:hypothetical protein
MRSLPSGLDCPVAGAAAIRVIRQLGRLSYRSRRRSENNSKA